jgi:hypothetical protein
MLFLSRPTGRTPPDIAISSIGKDQLANWAYSFEAAYRVTERGPDAQATTKFFQSGKSQNQ